MYEQVVRTWTPRKTVENTDQLSVRRTRKRFVGARRIDRAADGSHVGGRAPAHHLAGIRAIENVSVDPTPGRRPLARPPEIKGSCEGCGTSKFSFMN